MVAASFCNCGHTCAVTVGPWMPSTTSPWMMTAKSRPSHHNTPGSQLKPILAICVSGTERQLLVGM